MTAYVQWFCISQGYVPQWLAEIQPDFKGSKSERWDLMETQNMLN